MLKPVDITVLCGLLSWPRGQDWTQVEVARRLSISQSNVHRALRQLERSGLWSCRAPRKTAIEELLTHAVRYVYPPEFGPPARGLPTAHAGPATSGQLVAEDPYVWPWEKGPAFGTALEPLHPCVSEAASTWPKFYELMAVVDVFRVGRTREVRIAREWLGQQLGLVR